MLLKLFSLNIETFFYQFEKETLNRISPEQQEAICSVRVFHFDFIMGC